ncbi:MAG: polyprenyl synthetase family protein [Eubacteriales bacterium]
MDTFLQGYTSTKEMFEKKLTEYIASIECYPQLNDAMAYSLNAGGKRLRPVLMIECSKMIGLDAEKIMPLAISIELVHTYSLIHDDLPAMDDDDLRRGKPTNHKVYGEAMAVLAGDGLLNLAFENAMSCLDSDNCENYINAVRKLFSSSGANGMIGGQAMDIANTGKFQSQDELERMHRMKTGALFEACCICPALLLGSNSDIMNCLQEYSKHLGLLFQIKDDILDVVGSQEELGKTIGKDMAQEKSTFVSHMGLDGSMKYAQEIAEKAKSPLKTFGEKGEFLSLLIDYILERNK